MGSAAYYGLGAEDFAKELYSDKQIDAAKKIQNIRRSPRSGGARVSPKYRPNKREDSKGKAVPEDADIKTSSSSVQFSEI